MLGDKSSNEKYFNEYKTESSPIEAFDCQSLCLLPLILYSLGIGWCFDEKQMTVILFILWMKCFPGALDSK